MKKVLFVLGLLTLLFSVVNGQVSSSNNVLNSTGVTAIQSITSGYKLSVGGAVKQFGTGNNGTGSPTLYLRNTTAGTGRNFGINSGDGGLFQVFDSNASNAIRFVINSSGKIGIGTASPAEQLTIAGTDGNIYIGSAIGTAGYNVIRLNGSSVDNDYNFASKATDKSLWISRPNGNGIYFEEGGNYSISMPPGGNFGIGTGNTAAAKLEINATGSGDGILLRNASNGFTRVFPSNLASGAYNALTQVNDGGIIFGTSLQGSGTNSTFGFVLAPWHHNAAGLRMDANGNVGIGLYNPSAPLDVNGNIKATGLILTGGAGVNKILGSDASGNATWQAASALFSGWSLAGNGGTNPATQFIGTTDNQPLVFKTNNAEQLRLAGNGNFLVGTSTDDGSNKLQVNGSIKVNGVNINEATNNVNLLNINGYSTSNTLNAIANISENSTTGVLPYKTHNIITFRAPNMQIGDNAEIFLGKTLSSKQSGYLAYYYGGDTTFGHSAFIFDSYGLGTYPHAFWFDSSYYIGYGLKKIAGIKLGVNGAASFKGAVYAGYTNSSVLTDSSFTPRKYVDSLFSNQSQQISNGWSVNGNSGTNPSTAFIGTADNQPVIFKTNNTETMRIGANGNIGIGTSSISDPYKLSVSGDIRAHKIKVYQDAWSDYVFDNDYRLPTLADVQQYINRHKHLPDVPSAKEVEQNGLDLGGNQAVLLRKIEELTLYAIEQNKQIEDQNKKLEQQQQQIDELIKLAKKK